MPIRGKIDTLRDSLNRQRRVEALFIGVVIILFTTLLMLLILYT